MSRILTITLNPALDLASSVDRVIAGPKLRCAAPRIDPGGGGINVSRVVAELGGHSQALVVVGGAPGLQIVELLREEEISVVPIPAGGSTRQSLAITDTSTANQFRFVFPGPNWSDAAKAKLFTALKDNVERYSLVVLSGSFPPGAGSLLLVEIADVVRELGGSLCLDTSGPALQSVLGTSVGLRLLRLDRVEAQEFAGRTFDTPAELADYGRSLLDSGVAEQIALSLAEQGTLGVTKESCVFCAPPEVATDSTVGAGDSLMGALVLKLAEGSDFTDALRFGTAAAAAAVTTPATALCRAEDVKEIARKVTVSNH